MPKKNKDNSPVVQSQESDKSDELKRAMILALESTLGVVTGACKRVGISRQTHYRWREEDAAYREAVDEISEICIDFVESQLHRQIRDGNTVATIFYLKTKAKKRGYVEKHEIEHSGEALTKTIIKWGDKEIEV
jgi:hypothetical protein